MKSKYTDDNTLTQKVIFYIKERDYFNALKIAKDFTRTVFNKVVSKRAFSKEEQKTIRRAYEMYKNESFYIQLGFDKEKEINKAIGIIQKTYNI